MSASRRRRLHAFGARLLTVARDCWWKLLHWRARDETRNLAFGSCLVLAPHPDDETLGCGATILRKRAAGSTVSVAILTDGRHRNRVTRLTGDEIAAIRRAEALEACRQLGVADDRVFFFDLPNGELPQLSEVLRARLAALIEQLDPDEIFTTPARDSHRDHDALGRAVADLVHEGVFAGVVYEYPIWARTRWPWSRGFRVAASALALRSLVVRPLTTLLENRALTVATGGHLEAKREAVSAYRSQLTNITGEPDWRTLEPDFVERFLQKHELFLRADGRPAPNGSGRQKTRVLNLMPALIFGGGQFHVLRHLQNMDPERFDHTVAYVLPRSEMEHDFRRAGLRPVSLDHRRLLHAPRTVFRLVRLIKRERIDVVHTNTRYDRLYGQLAALLCGVPVVNTLRGEYSANRYEYSRNQTLWLRKPLARLRFALEDALERRTVVTVISVSDDIREAWLAQPRARRVANGSVTVIRMGLAFEKYGTPHDATVLEPVRRELGIDGRRPVIVNVSRLTPGKGQCYLVDLTAKVRERWPDAVTLIAGEGRERGELERQIAAAGLEDAVVLLGNRSDVPQLLALGDVFVFPSLSEGLPPAVVEAQASGATVLGFDIPGLRELVDDGNSGRLVPVGDGTALTNACIELLDEPARTAAMGRLGREQAQARFDVGLWAARLGSVYEHAAARCCEALADAETDRDSRVGDSPKVGA